MKENGSVIRIFSILELISKHPEGLTLGQIYRELEMPKATVYDILQTLYGLDAIYYKDPNLKNYVIGSKMYAIGSVYTKNSNLIEVSEKHLKQFSENTGYTTQVAKRIGKKIIYVYKYEPRNVKIITETNVGTIYYDTSSDISGKCYQAFNDGIIDESQKEFIGKGFLTEVNGSTLHIRNFAAPIRNFENKVVGVVIASDLEVSGETHENVVKELLNNAKKISRDLGYLGDLD